MARTKQNEEEEYELSCKSEDAVNFYWPDTVTPEHPFFERFMIELQISLIEGHINIMYASDKRRALKTVKYLKNKLGGGTCGYYK